MPVDARPLLTVHPRIPDTVVVILSYFHRRPFRYSSAGGRLGTALPLALAVWNGCGWGQNLADAGPDSQKLQQIRGAFEKPQMDGAKDPPEVLPDWYIAW